MVMTHALQNSGEQYLLTRQSLCHLSSGSGLAPTNLPACALSFTALLFRRDGQPYLCGIDLEAPFNRTCALMKSNRQCWERRNLENSRNFTLHVVNSIIDSLAGSQRSPPSPLPHRHLFFSFEERAKSTSRQLHKSQLAAAMKRESGSISPSASSEQLKSKGRGRRRSGPVGRSSHWFGVTQVRPPRTP